MNEQLMRLAVIVAKNFTKHAHYNFPVNKIHDVSVECKLLKGHKQHWIFEIVTDTDECCETTDDDYIPIELFRKHYEKQDDTPLENHIYDVLVDIKDLIPKLKFNKLESCFTLLEVEDDLTALFDEMFKHESVKMQYDNCSACMEATKRETWCKHYLCIPCHSSIKKVDDEYGDKYKPCPICRKSI